MDNITTNAPGEQPGEPQNKPIRVTNTQLLMLERCQYNRGLYSHSENGNTFRALKRRGLIARVDGFKTLYTLTDAGRAAIDAADGQDGGGA